MIFGGPFQSVRREIFVSFAQIFHFHVVVFLYHQLSFFYLPLRLQVENEWKKNAFPFDTEVSGGIFQPKILVK